MQNGRKNKQFIQACTITHRNANREKESEREAKCAKCKFRISTCCWRVGINFSFSCIWTKEHSQVAIVIYFHFLFFSLTATCHRHHLILLASMVFHKLFFFSFSREVEKEMCDSIQVKCKSVITFFLCLSIRLCRKQVIKIYKRKRWESASERARERDRGRGWILRSNRVGCAGSLFLTRNLIETKPNE